MDRSDGWVLVTGASGFLGRRLCHRLQLEGRRVVALGRTRREGPWERFIEADIAQRPIPTDALAGVAVDTVFHLASKAHAVAETAAEAHSYRPVIVDGTARMLTLAEGLAARSFIYISTVKVMGEGWEGPLDAPLNEEHQGQPAGPYGRAKAEAEQRVRQSGLPHWVILRPVMVYGPGEKGNLPRMVEAVRKGRFPPLPDCGNRRSMIHVDDLIEFMLRASGKEAAHGRTYILAGKDALSTRQLYDAIRASLGLQPVDYAIPLWLLQAAASVGSLVGGVLGRRLPLDRETLGKLTAPAWYSVDRAERELGYTPLHSVVSWLQSGESAASGGPTA